MPLGMGGDPFYTPGNTYGAAFDWATTPLSNYYLEQNPRFAFGRYGAQQGVGIGDQSNFAKWFQSQFNNTQQGFGQALASNPMLQYQEYLGGLGGMDDWRGRFNAQTPGQRGEQPGRFAPSVRWLTR